MDGCVSTMIKLYSPQQYFQWKHFCLASFVCLQDFKKDMLLYRLSIDLVNIGEAASELCESNKKPKTSSSPLMPLNITFKPAGKPLKEMSAESKYDCEILKESSHILSHQMKRKRTDETYLHRCVDDFKSCKKQLVKLKQEDKIKKIIPCAILELLDSEERTQVFTKMG